MICPNCGANNIDGVRFCGNCGAQLGQTQQPQQPQPVYQQPQPVYQQYSYVQPQQPLNPVLQKKPKVLYLIAGILGAIGFILPFLPSFKAGSDFYGVFNTIGKKFSKTEYSYGGQFKQTSTHSIIVSEAFAVIFLIAMALLAVWAILSFLKKRPAGVFGIIASSIYMGIGALWTVTIDTGIKESCKSLVELTGVSMLMVTIGMAGIPISIIQLVKKKYL